jgi:hypothetical protein
LSNHDATKEQMVHRLRLLATEDAAVVVLKTTALTTIRRPEPAVK